MKAAQATMLRDLLVPVVVGFLSVSAWGAFWLLSWWQLVTVAGLANVVGVGVFRYRELAAREERAERLLETAGGRALPPGSADASYELACGIEGADFGPVKVLVSSNLAACECGARLWACKEFHPPAPEPEPSGDEASELTAERDQLAAMMDEHLDLIGSLRAEKEHLRRERDEANAQVAALKSAATATGERISLEARRGAFREAVASAREQLREKGMHLFVPAVGTDGRPRLESYFNGKPVVALEDENFPGAHDTGEIRSRFTDGWGAPEFGRPFVVYRLSECAVLCDLDERAGTFNVRSAAGGFVLETVAFLPEAVRHRPGVAQPPPEEPDPYGLRERLRGYGLTGF